MSCGLALMSLAGCHSGTDPYIREVRPAYDESGNPLPGYATLPVPYLRHMLKDLEQCYRDER